MFWTVRVVFVWYRVRAHSPDACLYLPGMQPHGYFTLLYSLQDRHVFESLTTPPCITLLVTQPSVLTSIPRTKGRTWQR